jgi:hypothetical protein
MADEKDRAKSTIAKVRPITDFTVSNPNQIRQTVTSHVCERDGLRRIGKH